MSGYEVAPGYVLNTWQVPSKPVVTLSVLNGGAAMVAVPVFSADIVIDGNGTARIRAHMSAESAAYLAGQVGADVELRAEYDVGDQRSGSTVRGMLTHNSSISSDGTAWVEIISYTGMARRMKRILDETAHELDLGEELDV